MGLRSLIALVSLMSVTALAASGCSKSAQKVEPETRGKRGETCLARNECDSGLACISGICSQNEFNVDVKAKQCTRVECDTDKDCCGEKATEVPDKCRGRDAICDPANRTIPGCVQTICTDSASCNGGTCNPGMCQGTYQMGTACGVSSDCPKNTCVIPNGLTTGTCSLSGATCDGGAVYGPCTQYGATCSTRVCNCINPEYDPTNEICTDPDCEDICLLRCTDSLCVQDQSCKTDAECIAKGLQICDGGRCVQCTSNKDCDTDSDETCEKGLCKKPCTQNEECGLFEECKKGDCVYVGCQSDRECILAASRNQTQNPSTEAAVSGGADDPRLYRCLKSDTADYNVCKIPCENDASCGQFQVCDGGFCKFIGCETDEECRAYLGITNQTTNDNKPYIATAKCEKPPTTAAP